MFRVIFIIMLCIGSVLCYPINKTDANSKLDKGEQHYPNGTVVGKYAYTDKEGNPIEVKYYADDASYGVELKSLKLVSGSSGSTKTPVGKAFKQSTIQNLLQNTETPLGLSADFYNPTNIKYKINDPFEILKKNNLKNTQFQDLKPSPDYEIYFQNELKAPKKCGKEKVRVYFDKDKRKIRDASHELDDTAKICSRF